MEQEVTAEIGTFTLDLKNIIVQVIVYFDRSKFEWRQQIIAKLFKSQHLILPLWRYIHHHQQTKHHLKNDLK